VNPRDHLDPELIEPLDGFLQATGGGFNLQDIAGMRAMLSGMIAAVKAEAPAIEGVDAEDLQVPGLGDAPTVAVRLYRPAAAARAPAATILWLHGGGYVLGDVELDDLMLRQMCKDTGCTVANVGYRLAPEHPYPAALEDAYATLRYLNERSSELGIDAARVGVAGASAGGGLAAGLALMTRDRGEYALAQQLLIYPALDDRNVEPAGPEKPDSLLWTRANALHAWSAYLGGPPGQKTTPAYAAPGRSQDLVGLPPAYIAVGALDPMLDENLDYARRLAAAGVGTELHVYSGAYHAFDVFAPMAAVSARLVADRNAALVAALHP
jgi:acetyl esterase/lipase